MPHIPVLLKEVIKYLNPKPGDKIIDATLGGGGHVMAIAEIAAPNGRVLGIEWDAELLKEFELKNNFILINDNYRNLKKIAENNNFLNADGVLIDLGISSWHLEESGRGFSFQKDEILDMRYSEKEELTAREIVNQWPPEEIEKVLKEYGEEKFAGQISREVVKTRKIKPIISTFQLVEAVRRAVPNWYQHRKIHFATKTFQALRIEVNDELGNLEAGLKQMPEVLKSGGRGAVISFHSLEDRVVKNVFKNLEKEGVAEIITKKPVRPGEVEISVNPRSRSAKLRCIQKT